MTKSLTDLLSEIETRAANATPGHWRQGRTLLTPQTKHWSKEKWDANEKREREWIFASLNSDDHGRGRVPICQVTPFTAGDNIEFIAHARTDVPKLLAVIRKLIEQRDEQLQTRGCNSYSYDAQLAKILEGEK